MKIPDPAPPTPRRELRPLTGVRAVACLWVLVLHLRLLFPKVLALVSTHWALAPLRQGFLGVDLFFLLSGFILCYNYARPGKMAGFKDYTSFLGLRLARIYPVHLFVLLVMIPLTLGSYKMNGKWPDWYGAWSFPANLLLVNGWTFPVVGSWNEPAWSVSAEWLAYLAFPFFLVLTARITSVGRALWFFVATFAVFITLCRLTNYPLSSSYGLLRIVFEFAAGCALYRLYRLEFGARWLQTSFADVLLLCGLAGTYAAAILFPATMPSQVGMVPVLALMLYTLAWGGGYCSRLLSTPVAEFGGHASYAVYMVQFPCFLVLNKAVRIHDSASLPVQLGLLLFYLFVIIVVGSLTHLYVEDPARKFCRRLAQHIASTRSPAGKPPYAAPVSVSANE